MLAQSSCKMASTTGYRAYRLGTGCTALYSLPNRLQSFYRPSPVNSVLTGAGRQQVSSRYGFNQPVTESTDWVPDRQPLLYSALPKPVTEYLPSPFNSVLILGQVDRTHLQEIALTDWLQSLSTECQLHRPYCSVYFTHTDYRAYRPSPFNYVLSLGQRNKKYDKKSRQQVSPTGYRPYGPKASFTIICRMAVR